MGRTDFWFWCFFIYIRCGADLYDQLSNPYTLHVAKPSHFKLLTASIVAEVKNNNNDIQKFTNNEQYFQYQSFVGLLYWFLICSAGNIDDVMVSERRDTLPTYMAIDPLTLKRHHTHQSHKLHPFSWTSYHFTFPLFVSVLSALQLPISQLITNHHNACILVFSPCRLNGNRSSIVHDETCKRHG